MNDDIDYTKFTLTDLVDAAEHIDRESFPERALALDAEIAARKASGEELPVSFRVGVSWGDTVWDWTAGYPTGTFSITSGSLFVEWPFGARLEFGRPDVVTIRLWTRWFAHGVQIVHQKAGYPPVVFVRAIGAEQITAALHVHGWRTEPAGDDPRHFA